VRVVPAVRMVVPVPVPVVVPVLVVGHDVQRGPDRADLDLDPDHVGRRRHHEGAHVTPDVEQDRALPGVRVLDLRGAHDACVVPGWVW
jgi:hypothetical protein